MPNNPTQGHYWICTMPHADFVPWLPPGVSWVKGQLEQGLVGGADGYLHWQFVVHLTKKARLGGIKAILGDRGHFELSRSEAATEYCSKEETRVEGTQFELGKRPFKTNSKIDWDQQYDLAIAGDFNSMDKGVLFRGYNNAKRIRMDNIPPVYRGLQKAYLFVGPTGTGKTRAAKSIMPDAFRKPGDTKWWSTYNNEKAVIVEEFCGEIPVSRILNWLDREPVLVQVHNGVTYLNTKVWIFTSNVQIKDWYPTLDATRLAALERRFEVHNLTSLQGTQQWVESLGKTWITDEVEDIDYLRQ